MKHLLALATLASTLSFASPLRHAVVNSKVKEIHLALTKGQCDPDHLTEAQTISLGHKAYLTLIPCVSGAYQMSYKGYILQNDEVTPLSILSYDERSGLHANDWLMSAEYHAPTEVHPAHPITSTLTTFTKFRGLGDCGETTETQLTSDDYGVYVRTTMIQYKEECDEKNDPWPVVFKQ